MTVQTQIEIQLRCVVCESVLTVESRPSQDKHGYWFYVEPCEKCGLTQRALDVCPECAGSGKTGSIGLPHECPYCDGTGKRK